MGGATGKAVRDLMEQYKSQGGGSSDYQDLIQGIESGEYGMSGYLDTYRNNPWALKNINTAQGRLLLRSDVFLTPDSGLLFFSYFTTPQRVQEAYQVRLDELVQKIIKSQELKNNEDN